VLRVVDHGIGIPETDLPYVLERFHRARNVGRINGTGLGLWGVRQIVEAHGGRLLIESREGQGTTATLWLPLTG
jgi:signal transduction histidine kinase